LLNGRGMITEKADPIDAGGLSGSELMLRDLVWLVLRRCEKADEFGRTIVELDPTLIDSV